MMKGGCAWKINVVDDKVEGVGRQTARILAGGIKV